MATAHWRTGFTVADLYTNPEAGWSFYQLVRLLLSEESQDPELSETSDSVGDAQAVLGELKDVSHLEIHRATRAFYLSQIEQPQSIENRLVQSLDKHFFFRASYEAHFPAGEVRAVTVIDSGRDDVSHKYQIVSLGNHISGLAGPLPDGLTELVVDDIKNRQAVLAHFLDLFNHRLQSLRYLFRSLTDATLAHAPAEHSEIGQMSLALSGNLLKVHRQLYQQNTDRFIGLAGSLANRRMSLPLIQELFRATLDVRLNQLKHCIGRWLRVEVEDHIRLGQANHCLGGEATLGTQIWDQQAAIGVVLGPLPDLSLKRLLPEGDRYSQLYRLLCWITDRKCDCEVTLLSDQAVSKALCLKGEGNQLGRLSRLGEFQGRERVTFMVDLARTNL
ncbi:type VI secretion system baseplate subunit TssG [Agarivorans sp. Z349TD_8]|uniref:type VI secretion system baseplate subunit TssG n=1 Tax=Agarivorans sp. Z349TD_8 TaxID=3421434 RepID=UPI003D7CBD89